jgi:hypothetical protein
LGKRELSSRRCASAPGGRPSTSDECPLQLDERRLPEGRRVGWGAESALSATERASSLMQAVLSREKVSFTKHPARLSKDEVRSPRDGFQRAPSQRRQFLMRREDDTQPDRPTRDECRVGRGGCPPRPPTDPDVRNSRIRLFALRIRLDPGPDRSGSASSRQLCLAILATCAMVCEDCGSPIRPTARPAARRRPLLRRVPRVGSPASLLLLRRSDFSRLVRPRFVAFAQPYLRCAPCSLPAQRALPARAWGFCLAGAPRRLSEGRRETSQVPGQPLCTCPALRPRWSRCARPFSAAMLPSAAEKASASTTI